MKTIKKILVIAMLICTGVVQVKFSHAQAAAGQSSEAIRPFKFHAPQADLDDLHRRILATKWPEKETVTDATQGVQLATVKALAKYWADDYDWRKAEKKLNSYPQFITSIDGLDIHFIHVRSKHKNALPVIITHGWPGSIIEQMKIIDPLVNPTTYGGKPEDAFDVVIPSMPGYGIFRQASHHRLGHQTHCKCLGKINEALGLHQICGARGRLGCPGHRTNGPASTT
jgi:hypothetical protein